MTPTRRWRPKDELLAIVLDGEPVTEALPGDQVELILPETGFYVESGGQVSDTGPIVSVERAALGDQRRRRPQARRGDDRPRRHRS